MRIRSPSLRRSVEGRSTTLTKRATELLSNTTKLPKSENKGSEFSCISITMSNKEERNNDDRTSGTSSAIVDLIMRDCISNPDCQHIAVKLYRDQFGKVLFVESTADFVNVIDKIQRAPLGMLLDVGRGSSPLHVFQKSCENIKDDDFVVNKSDALFGNQGNHPQIGPLKRRRAVLESGGSMTFEGSGSGPYTVKAKNDRSWTNGIAFSNLSDDFEITLKIPDKSTPTLFGVLPDSSKLETQCSTERIYRSCGFFVEPFEPKNSFPTSNKKYPEIFNNQPPVPGKMLAMRFQRSPQRLEYCYDGGPWHLVQIARGFGIEKNTKCCPVLLTSSGNPITIVNVGSYRQSTVLLKPQKTYFVTNELEVKEMSMLLKHFAVDNLLRIPTLHIDEIEFGRHQLSKLIEALVNKRPELLEAILE